MLTGLGFAIVTGLTFGAIPAWRSSRPDVVETLKEGGRSGDPGGGRSRLRSSLIVAEMALALMLLVSAAVTTQGSLDLLYGDHGYNPDNLLTMQITLPEARYPNAEQIRQFYTDAQARLGALPAVLDVAVISHLPSSGGNTSSSFVVEGRPTPLPGQRPSVDIRSMSPGYLHAMQIPLLRGRTLTPLDDEHAPMVAAISQSMARRFWPDEDPIGSRVKFGGDDQPWVEIVGISGDVIHNWHQELLERVPID